jgi:hypothetical protein
MDNLDGLQLIGDPGDISDKIDILQKAVWARRPILGEIIQKHGTKTLFNYSLDFLDVNRADVFEARRPELVDVVHEVIQERLGNDVADKVTTQLNELPLVSTAEHHAMLTHPFWVNSCIISSLPLKTDNQKQYNFHVVFSFASVSMNNASAYSRGIIFHGGMGADRSVTLPIFPDKYKMSAVYAMRSYNIEDIHKANKEVDRKVVNKIISEKRGTQVRDFLNDFLCQEKYLSARELNCQISRINFDLWPLLFREPGQRASVVPPQLIFLDIETIITRTLLKIHLVNSDSLIHKLLFSLDWRKQALRRFDGLEGGFSVTDKSGTFMFWGLDAKFHRVRLMYDAQKNTLRSEDGALIFSFTPEGIINALKNKQIFPSMLLCYLVVSLYYGFKCLGGFCQVHDLTMVKRAWREILLSTNNLSEAGATDVVQTKEFGGDGLILAYYKKSNGRFTPATGIDLYLEDHDKDYGRFCEFSRGLKLGDLMESMLPEMYSVLYPSYERDPALVLIRPEHILEFNGLMGKIEKANG